MRNRRRPQDWIAASLLCCCLTAPLHAQRPAARTPPALDASSLRLSAQTQPVAAVGEPVLVALALKNISSGPVEVPSFRSSLLKVTVEQANPASKWESLLDGSVRTRQRQLSDGQALTLHYQILPEKAVLQPDAQVERVVDLAKECHTLIPAGDYTVTVEYEDALTASAKFQVAVSEDKTVPALLDLIANGALPQKIWARNYLFFLTGQPSWDLSEKDNDPNPQLTQRLTELRAWWSDNRARLKLEGTRFVPR